MRIKRLLVLLIDIQPSLVRSERLGVAVKVECSLMRRRGRRGCGSGIRRRPGGAVSEVLVFVFAFFVRGSLVSGRRRGRRKREKREEEREKAQGVREGEGKTHS